MKEIKEIAANYAVGKANDAIDKAVAQAYADGYRDGYKDREEEIPADLRDDRTVFVDLGSSVFNILVYLFPFLVLFDFLEF